MTAPPRSRLEIDVGHADIDSAKRAVSPRNSYTPGPVQQAPRVASRVPRARAAPPPAVPPPPPELPPAPPVPPPPTNASHYRQCAR